MVLNHFSPIYHRTNYRLYYCLDLVVWLLWTYLCKWKLIHILKLRALCRLKFNHALVCVFYFFFPLRFFSWKRWSDNSTTAPRHCTLHCFHYKPWSSCLIISLTQMIFELSFIQKCKKIIPYYVHIYIIKVLEPFMCMLIYFMFTCIYMGMNNYAHRKYITMHIERYVYYTHTHACINTCTCTQTYGYITT